MHNCYRIARTLEKYASHAYVPDVSLKPGECLVAIEPLGGGERATANFIDNKLDEADIPLLRNAVGRDETEQLDANQGIEGFIRKAARSCELTAIHPAWTDIDDFHQTEHIHVKRCTIKDLGKILTELGY